MEAIIVGVMRLCAFEKCFSVIKLTDVGQSLCCAELQSWISGEAIGGLGVSVSGRFCFASLLACVDELGQRVAALAQRSRVRQRGNGHLRLVLVPLTGRDS